MPRMPMPNVALYPVTPPVFRTFSRLTINLAFAGSWLNNRAGILSVTIVWLVDDARAWRFDILCAEALDRTSRDQEDIAQPMSIRPCAFRELLCTVTEGLTDEMRASRLGISAATACGSASLTDPAVRRIPHGQSKTLTFLAGLRHDRIVAPFVLDGPINSIAFAGWVEQCLAPTLNPGDIVVLDDLDSHKGKPARNAVRDAGPHLFFLSPYSPDLNPIKMMFAKFKTLLRAAGERTIEATWRRVGQCLKTFTPQECAAYLQACGI